MTNEKLIEMLQEDLQNERMHCLFYQQAAAQVAGLHREEFRELFLKEAQSELHHVDEFATLITQLGGVPDTKVASLPKSINWNCINDLCHAAHGIESKVAETYALRLCNTEQTHPQIGAATSYVHLFYEDQLTDSQKAAFEFKLLCKGGM